jgi:hypothetical protein
MFDGVNEACSGVATLVRHESDVKPLEREGRPAGASFRDVTRT